ncbi:conserved hypothetical protein [Theileria orientalis strain Shintoku]|uniref:Uncharacterized protein n=1 Tax=Theileria orientalis strain Shintoku TaxID=869250 RepID=J4C4A5_THEOR|nr:conserved hypothetical protein [Theileria orientalis strain Shintoku]PVC52968.1 hypothetical protein MACL_00000413 [Theileria orientalis]BAM41846.1 conserved hypothetical protein [Theileria orientalis strain Shintoku]|eukprot:XP_009692147.1 conserved hypothetical protein [Theileria orientalis strain Shintoku]
MFAFKSDSHRTLFHNMLKLQIKSRILSRFGGMGQEECRILRTKPFNDFVSLWANSIINKLPRDYNSHSDYVNSQINCVSQEILDLPSVKDIINANPSVKWMIERINSDKDNVPKPYFPSVLRNHMIQFPFKHQDIQKSRDLYGLLKFPFYKLSTSLYGDPSESFKGLVEPKTSHTYNNEVEPDNLIDKSDYPEEGNSSHLKNDQELIKYCSSNYIYAPSELETGLKES